MPKLNRDDARPRLFSGLFRAGQVIETFRGKGVYQLAVEESIEKLDDGQWVCGALSRLSLQLLVS